MEWSWHHLYKVQARNVGGLWQMGQLFKGNVVIYDPITGDNQRMTHFTRHFAWKGKTWAKKWVMKNGRQALVGCKLLRVRVNIDWTPINREHEMHVCVWVIQLSLNSDCFLSTNQQSMWRRLAIVYLHIRSKRWNDLQRRVFTHYFLKSDMKRWLVEVYRMG